MEKSKGFFEISSQAWEVQGTFKYSSLSDKQIASVASAIIVLKVDLPITKLKLDVY